MSPQFWWYVARAAGMVAWVMLTASVIWGVVLSTKAFPEHRRPAWLLDLHRWLGGLTVSFVVLHLLALVADSYSHFGLAELALPFASDWERGAVALGVVAAWLLVAVELTSLAMRRLPRRVWKGIHALSYVVFWLTSLHAAFAGTDGGSPLYLVTAVASVLAVVWATMYRIANRRSTRARTSAEQAPPARCGSGAAGTVVTQASSRAPGDPLHD